MIRGSRSAFQGSATGAWLTAGAGSVAALGIDMISPGRTRGAEGATCGAEGATCGAVVAGGSAGAAFPAGSTAAARSAASGLSVAVTASVSAFGSGDSDPAGA